MAADIQDVIARHLPDGLREQAEERIRQAAPHYLWFFTGAGEKGEKLGFCSNCLNTMRCAHL